VTGRGSYLGPGTYVTVGGAALKNYGPNLGYDYGGRLVSAWLSSVTGRMEAEKQDDFAEGSATSQSMLQGGTTHSQGPDGRGHRAPPSRLRGVDGGERSREGRVVAAHGREEQPLKALRDGPGLAVADGQTIDGDDRGDLFR